MDCLAKSACLHRRSQHVREDLGAVLLGLLFADQAGLEQFGDLLQLGLGAVGGRAARATCWGCWACCAAMAAACGLKASACMGCCGMPRPPSRSASGSSSCCRSRSRHPGPWPRRPCRPRWRRRRGWPRRPGTAGSGSCRRARPSSSGCRGSSTSGGSEMLCTARFSSLRPWLAKPSLSLVCRANRSRRTWRPGRGPAS